MSKRRAAMFAGSLILLMVCVPLLQMLLPAYPRYGKGGVGLVSEKVYVLTRAGKNEALDFGTHDTLFAGSGETPQVAVVAGHGTQAPVLLLFTRRAIYFYDFSHLRGGNYLRSEAR